MFMLRKDFIKTKIELIESDLLRLAEFKDDSINDIAGDFFKLNVVERLLEKIIMRAIDINEHIIAEMGTGEEGRLDYKKTFLYLTKFSVYPEKSAERISQSAGLRHALVHDYDEIRIADVYNSIGEALAEFHKYCGYLLTFIKKQNKKTDCCG